MMEQSLKENVAGILMDTVASSRMHFRRQMVGSILMTAKLGVMAAYG